MKFETLRTASGKEFQSDYLAVIPDPAQAFIRILGKKLPEVAAIFSSELCSFPWKCYCSAWLYSSGFQSNPLWYSPA